MAYLDNIAVFVRVIELGNLSAAGRDMRISPAVASNRIKELEKHLGVRLFNRVHRSVVLTEAGTYYAAEVTAAFARIDRATRNVATAGGSAILTVHSTPSFATQWLVPRLARFKELNPDIDIRLNASVAHTDLAEDGIDATEAFEQGSPPIERELERLVEQRVETRPAVRRWNVHPWPAGRTIVPNAVEG